MATSLRTLLEQIARLQKNDAKERTHYRPLQDYLEERGRELKIATDAEEPARGRKIGFPDITVRRADKIIGWVEVKLPRDELGKPRDEQQFAKYKDNLENVIFTNFRRWELWQWNTEDDSEMPSVMIDAVDIDIDPAKADKADDEKLSKLLNTFFTDRHVHHAATPQTLAIALARKTKLLRLQVEESFRHFARLKKAFSEMLIQEISEHQFSNFVVETLTYSLFLATLEHSHRQKNKPLDLESVSKFLPPNVPILHDLYDLFQKVGKKIHPVRGATKAVLDELESADLHGIYAELAKRKPNEDPVVNFYEPFLAEYDPEERKKRGVYYTPKPVVDFIVDSVDTILEEKFGKAEGIADKSVRLLDPATGTGTFLMSAMQKVEERVRQKYAAIGLAPKHLAKAAREHILKHFYGFELMVTPYAIAHFKLTLELQEKFGFHFKPSAGQITTERLRIYLANALDDPGKTPTLSIPGFDSIPKEGKAAMRVKNRAPILAIIGNPPYANFGMMNEQDDIMALLDDYKKGLGEKKTNLNDDYIKFIRFAQWKLEKRGQGVFAMITANSFLDGVTHRQMRRSLLDTFDEIYIYNLHGNARKKEKCPDGSPDQNVFDIMTGVSINIFVKLPGNKGQPCVVRSADAWGSRADKFKLLEQNFAQVKWQEIDYVAANEAGGDVGELNFFVPRHSVGISKEYNAYPGVTEIFKQFGSCVKTDRDELVLDFEESKLAEKMQVAFSGEYDEEFAKQYRIKNSGSYKCADKLRDESFDEKAIRLCQYRPFDNRFLYYKTGFTSRPAWDTAKHMLEPNLGLIVRRTAENTDAWYQMFVANGLADVNFLSAQTYFIPLYLHYEKKAKKFQRIIPPLPNINPGFISEMAGRLGVDALTPEQIFYYAYAVFHCPAYRKRYAELLKIDFPRLPITADKSLFKKLVRHGNKLVNLHLLGDNPFDADAAKLFADKNQWHIQYGKESPHGIDSGEIIKIEHKHGNRVYINRNEYFAGIDRGTFAFMVGGYQVLDKWLKDRRKAARPLSLADMEHYIKIAFTLRETRKVMDELAASIPTFPIK